MATTTTRSGIPDAARIPIRDALRSALLDLLTTDHHDAATPATLTAVSKTRRGLAERSTNPETDSPVGRFTHPYPRLAGLSHALGLIGSELLAQAPPTPTAPCYTTDSPPWLRSLSPGSTPCPPPTTIPATPCARV
jgi:hypothetical protein